MEGLLSVSYTHLLQELISDISHQVKTPIANLKVINSTLLENEVPVQKQKEFLTAQATQLDKLDFLMQAMIKTSRLETGVISLDVYKRQVLLIWCVKNSSAAVPREKNWNRPVPQYGISSNRSCPPISLPPRKDVYKRQVKRIPASYW